MRRKDKSYTEKQGELNGEKARGTTMRTTKAERSETHHRRQAEGSLKRKENPDRFKRFSRVMSATRKEHPRTSNGQLIPREPTNKGFRPKVPSAPNSFTITQKVRGKGLGGCLLGRLEETGKKLNKRDRAPTLNPLNSTTGRQKRSALLRALTAIFLSTWGYFWRVRSQHRGGPPTPKKMSAPVAGVKGHLPWGKSRAEGRKQALGEKKVGDRGKETTWAPLGESVENKNGQRKELGGEDGAQLLGTLIKPRTLDGAASTGHLQCQKVGPGGRKCRDFPGTHTRKGRLRQTSEIAAPQIRTLAWAGRERRRRGSRHRRKKSPGGSKESRPGPGGRGGDPTISAFGL